MTNEPTTINRTEETREYSRARAYIKRYAKKSPVKAETRARLGAAYGFIRDTHHAELSRLPASIPSNSPVRGYDGRRVYHALAAILDNPKARNHARRTLRYETYLERDVPGRPITIRYHATDVVTVYPDGQITLAHKGWTTTTTSARINDFLSDYVRGVGGFPSYIHVGGTYLPDSALPDNGRSTWYVIVEDRAGRSIRREARYYPNTTRTIRGGYHCDATTGRWAWDPDYLHDIPVAGRFRDYQTIERPGTYVHHAFSRDGFTIGPRGHIESPAQVEKRVRAENRAALKRHAEQYARDQIELARVAALSDDERAAEEGWTPVPADTPLYKVLDIDPGLADLPTDSKIAGRAPYQHAFLWYENVNCAVEGVLVPCQNALHAATAEQLHAWYQPGPRQQVVYTFLPLEPAYSAQGKTFTRSARLGRKLTVEALADLLGTS